MRVDIFLMKKKRLNKKSFSHKQFLHFSQLSLNSQIFKYIFCYDNESNFWGIEFIVVDKKLFMKHKLCCPFVYLFIAKNVDYI